MGRGGRGERGREASGKVIPINNTIVDFLLNTLDLLYCLV
jgi:hypothetical protein